MGRSGPSRDLGMIAMGRDLVAVDSTCARVIGFDPAKLRYTSLGGEYLGNSDDRRIEQRGEPVARFATTFDVLDMFKPLRLGS